MAESAHEGTSHRHSESNSDSGLTKELQDQIRKTIQDELSSLNKEGTGPSFSPGIPAPTPNSGMCTSLNPSSNQWRSQFLCSHFANCTLITSFHGRTARQLRPHPLFSCSLILPTALSPLASALAHDVDCTTTPVCLLSCSRNPPAALSLMSCPHDLPSRLRMHRATPSSHIVGDSAMASLLTLSPTPQ